MTNNIKQIGNIVKTGNFKNPQRGRIYSIEGIAPSLNTVAGGGLEPKIIVKIPNNDKNCYRIRKLTPLECWRLMGFSDEDFLSAKLGSRETAKELIKEYEPDNHLAMMRKAESESKVSNSQLYKQSGNSIVTNVLFYIYKELYKAMPYLFDNLKVGSFFSGIGAFEIALDRLFNDIKKEG